LSVSHCSEREGAHRTLPLRVGLTGGIGSGKSLVSDELARLGAHVVDADAIAHELTAPAGAAMTAIAQRFGPSFVRADGALDRTRMRELVFRDGIARAALEAILHPRFRALTEERAAAAPAGAPYVVLVVPLLIESGGWRERIDRVLVVDCPIATQIERVMRRSGLVESAVRAIISRQIERRERLNAADDVLVNDGPIDRTIGQTRRLHGFYAGLNAVHAASSRGAL
jgi:dephospho-CoA kinase